MPHNFGRHAASEVVEKAKVFIDQANNPAVWLALSDPHRGRMTSADLAEGKKRLATATGAIAGSQQHAAATKEPALKIDSADEAASSWLADQLVHVRGALHESGDEPSVAALRQILAPGESHQTHAANIRAYANAAKASDTLGKAITATYTSSKARDAILKDGLYLAAALEAELGEVGAAMGARKEATSAKDQAVDALARWLRRWSLVAHRVCTPAALSALGLASARHHPEHRPHHPVVVTSPAGGTPSPA